MKKKIPSFSWYYHITIIMKVFAYLGHFGVGIMFFYCFLDHNLASLLIKNPNQIFLLVFPNRVECEVPKGIKATCAVNVVDDLEDLFLAFSAFYVIATGAIILELLSSMTLCCSCGKRYTSCYKAFLIICRSTLNMLLSDDN